MKSAPTLEVTADFTKQFNEAIARFKNDAVLVGIPADETDRSGEETGITNAALLAINNFGSPANNIPPRPVMAIGIRNSQEKVAEQFKLCAQSVLKKGVSALELYYERAGIIASNAIKKAINDQEGFPGPADSTLRARAARGFAGKKSLIVTGQMRNAITYVVSKWGK
jgi:hypothetical protein